MVFFRECLRKKGEIIAIEPYVFELNLGVIRTGRICIFYFVIIHQGWCPENNLNLF